MDKTLQLIGVVYLGHTSHSQGYTKAQDKGMEKDLPSKWRAKKKEEVAILIHDKIDFKATTIKRDKERQYIMVKRSTQQEELMILNIYGPNTGAPRYIRQVLNELQRDLDSYIIIVETLTLHCQY